MSEIQYGELLKAYTKEAFSDMIKADIRQRFSEPLASIYCKQFDDARTLADFLETVAKRMRQKNHKKNHGNSNIRQQQADSEEYIVLILPNVPYDGGVAIHDSCLLSALGVENFGIQNVVYGAKVQ